MNVDKEEILKSIDKAFIDREFSIYIQPQYNHATKNIIGGEALVRWNHPTYGMIYPNSFIPVLEQEGKIVQLDLYVFEEVCKYIKNIIDRGEKPVAISFNVSREDLHHPDYIFNMEVIRTNYNIPVKFLRVEITESSAIGGSEYMAEVINHLHKLGYIVEMDDFGAGYSSLNVLKDLDIDVIKLDMKFLSGKIGGRGGTIISSIVNMAKWLGTPVIAEGVETKEQADYMLSIGCDNIQGFYYSKPIPTDRFNVLIQSRSVTENFSRPSFIENLNVRRFWSPESLETLIFSNFVSGAAIFSYSEGRVEILRVNVKYLNEISMNMTEKELLASDPWIPFNEENKAKYIKTIEKAINTACEEECETWRTYRTDCCGLERLCIRSSIQLIGKFQNQDIFYVMIRNITREKTLFQNVFDSEKKFRMASEQANVYAWEYSIATREMRPCFRCMRDLGLPPLVENYPEPVIDNGLFPPEYADMYRDWHKQLAKGVDKLEAIIPLTVSRIPFHVRYTLECDSEGHPVKAYGSAVLVTKAEIMDNERMVG